MTSLSSVPETGSESRPPPADDQFIVTPDAAIDPVVSVVVPTMNEEAGITECMEWIRRGAESAEIPTEIIVSDSSTDRTPELAREAGARVVAPDGTGYGYAYQYAFDYVRGDYIVVGDADTTYDFSQFPRLLRELIDTDADIVLGSRFEGEIKPGAMPALHRYVGNPLLTRFLNTFYDTGVTDAHSGFRVIRRDALETLDLETTGMEFASEMIMAAGERDLDIREVPITYHQRTGDATLDSFRDGWRHLKFMLENAPGYVFSVPGAMLVFAGMVTMALSVQQAPLLGVFFGRHTAIVGSLMTVMGYQAMSLAVFSTLAADAIRLPSDPITRWVVESIHFEHGAIAGVGMVGLGSATMAFYGAQWARTAGTITPSITTTMYSFTVIVMGLQTVFYAFFISVLRDSRM